MEEDIYQQFIRQVCISPEKLALITDGDQFSFDELFQRVEHAAEKIKDIGIMKGSHVALLLPNGVEFIVFMLLAAKCRFVLVPLFESLPLEGVVSAVKSTKVSVLVYSKSREADFTLISKVQNASNIDSIKKLNCVPVSKIIEQNFICERKDANKLLHTLKNTKTETTPYILTMTSGSTGKPKPILLTQQTKLGRIRAAKSLYSITNDDVVLAATPLYHSLAERLTLIALTQGLTLRLLNFFTAEKWVEAIEKSLVTFTIAVSSQLKQILPMIKSEPDRIRSLRCLVSSSEKLNGAVRRDLLDSLSCDFHECYGTSEISIATNLSFSEYQRDTKRMFDKNESGFQSALERSVGTAAPGVEIKIIDENNEAVKVGQIGEIICRTDLQFSGYFEQEKVTKQAFIKGYFKTGDLGWLDENQFLYFHGRKKDIIITGGINVYPKDIEELYISHPKIDEVCVIGIPDEKLGEMVCAVIVSHDNKPISSSELRRYSLGRLADFQYPRKHVFVDEISKNKMGKVDRKKVLAQVN